VHKRSRNLEKKMRWISGCQRSEKSEILDVNKKKVPHK